MVLAVEAADASAGNLHGPLPAPIRPETIAGVVPLARLAGDLSLVLLGRLSFSEPYMVLAHGSFKAYNLNKLGG